jgi:hypothetical protein
MDHMKLSDELRNQLLEAAEWGKAGITPTPRTNKAINEESAEEVEESEEGEELQEAYHVCPLCTSYLEEEISEETLLEHLDVVLGLVDRLSQLNEGDEDVDEVIDAALEEILLGPAEEEYEEEEE